MRAMFVLLAGFSVLGCANKPLTHNYNGEVTVRTLTVDLAPLNESDSESDSDFRDITRIAKGIQEVLDVFDPEQSRILFDQLDGFEQVLIDGIAQKSSLPLVLPSSEVNLHYGDDNELSHIEYAYPWYDGAYLNVFVTVYYTQSSQLSIGGGGVSSSRLEVKPEMIEEATLNAREVAEKFAKDSKSTLGKIKRANQGQFSISSRDSHHPHIKKVRVVSTIEYTLID